MRYFTLGIPDNFTAWHTVRSVLIYPQYKSMKGYMPRLPDQEDYTLWMVSPEEYQAEAKELVKAEIKASRDIERERERWHRDFVQVY